MGALDKAQPMPGIAPGLVRGRKRIIAQGYDEDAGTWEPGSVAYEILRALEVGNFITAAAGYAGVSHAAVHDWLARGREHDPGPDGDIATEVPETEQMYVYFLRGVNKATARAEFGLVATVRKGAQTDPKLALQLLGRRFPDWREHKGIDVTVADDRKQDQIAKAVAADPNLAMKAQDFALALGTAVPDDDNEEG